MNREWNWKKTGGAIGEVRRLPGYTILQNPKTERYIVKCDKTGQTVSAGHATPEDAEKANAFRHPYEGFGE